MNQITHKKRELQQQKSINFDHYVGLILEKKWWIILITILISTIWFLIYPIFLDKEKKYSFSAIIRFDDPRISRGISGVDDRFTEMETESKIRMIRTSNFLTAVVDSLSLNILSLSPDINREEIFKEINLNNDKRYGKYKLVNTDDKLDIFYTNEKENIENEFINTVSISKDSLFLIDIKGIQAKIYASLFQENESVEFGCIATRFVVENIRKDLELSLNRQQTILTISYKNPDYYLGVKITNCIAELFLAKSYEIKQIRTSSTLAALEEQLQSSKTELEQIEEQLRQFREKNPKIYLTENMDRFNNTLTSNEIERDRLENDIERLSLIIDEKNNATSINDRNLLYGEILTFLEEQEIAGITALNEQYKMVIEEREELLEENFSESNLQMIEINNSINSIQKKIDERSKHYLNEQSNRLSKIRKSIENSERSLRQRPNKELQLAKFERDRYAKAQVYSHVLVRYNEVKTTHASITPDAYLLERAEPPIVYFGFIDDIIVFIKIMFGPLLGLAFSVVLFIGMDFIWHHARSSEDIENLLKKPVIAKIPVIKSSKAMQHDFKNNKMLDSQLITIDYSPDFEAESFRNLRTKLILNDDSNRKDQFIITSFKPNDGKSLVASNLAVTFAQLKKPTLLIDGDVRRGVLHNNFVCSKMPGLSDVLRTYKNDEMGDLNKIIQKTTIPNLFLISCGNNIPNPTELFMDVKIENFIRILKNKFNYILIDTPPIEFIQDALIINRIIQNMILVVRYGITDLNKLQSKMRDLSNSNIQIKGIVLNGAKNLGNKKYYGYSYYKY